MLIPLRILCMIKPVEKANEMIAFSFIIRLQDIHTNFNYLQVWEAYQFQLPSLQVWEVIEQLFVCDPLDACKKKIFSHNLYYCSSKQHIIIILKVTHK